MVSRRFRRFLVNPFLVTFIVSQCYAEDPVKDCLATIAKGGLFKTVVQDVNSHSYSSVKSWFCSQDFMNAAQNHSTSAAVQTPWGGGTFNSDDASQLTQRNQFCQSTSSDFDNQQSSYLVLKEGDPVIAQTMQACLAAAPGAVPYLTPVVNPYPDGTFDILLNSRAYPGNNPLIVSQTILGGATSVDIAEMHAGASIPFQGSGTTSITGTYKFDNGSPMARVKVMTSIGSVTVIAARCPTGKIGTWEIDEDVQQSVQTPMAPFSDSRPVPQAGCHPRCGAGDFPAYDFTVPNDVVLSSATAHLAGGGSVFDSLVLTQAHPFQIHIVVNTRSSPTTLVLNASQIKVSTQTIRQKIDAGDISAGHAFTVKLNDGTNAAVVVKDSSETAITLTAVQLQADNSIPSWLKLTSVPQHSGNSLLANLISSGPASCIIP
jgi:hypothetical protein